ncbi:unnamed protein product [Brassica rapa]|uniref:Cyclin N-terminal domain-containing protein n=1 Tax=Brassica campestris TaxID=3711 RepID=A0A8D9HP46_BRACM|nr:unnamed protein product [Brassica rapa]
MGNEKAVSGNTIPLHPRPITRALARASSNLATSSEVAATSTTLINNQGRVLRANSKRTASDDKNANAPKRRAVLNDITNVACENKIQIKKGRASSSRVTNAEVQVVCTGTNEASSCSFIEKPSSKLPPRPPGRSTSTVERSCVGGSSIVASSSKFIDIDSDVKDHLLCSLYAPEIHYNMRVAELKRRPSPDFMERTQRDVTKTMRGILVDWLVEVSEEYTLVPDTLYLTVYLIDWFLHGNYIERQRLQLLGITCMLIASKYEEIYAPRIEEFCFITDNTYTRDQVLEMESQVLKHFSFQIYTPTSKTFLRRFLRAAQASHVMPSVEMEFLANYLTELTLVECEFLKFLPSVIAASAVFLAKWTMNQSSHPWNATLEHYTTYKASDLKACVQALQELQLNTKGCPLNSIRMKYKQDKDNHVVTHSSSSSDKLQTHFSMSGCGCSWIQDNSMLHYSATSNWTSKKCSALPTTKTVDVSSVSDLFEFICSGPLVDKIGITPEKVGQAIDKWLLYGSQLCRLFQLNELKLTIPQKARLYHYYIPVFVWCQDQIALHSSKFNDGDDVPPLVIGFSAPQGCGKTTLVFALDYLFKTTKMKSATISIDDFYLTAEGQAKLREENPGNALLEYRGNAGSHDLPFSVETLEALTKLTKEGMKMKVPRYDKSAYSGRGDRADPTTWPEVEGPLKVILFEGWMLGFKPLPAEVVKAVDPQLEIVNKNLEAYYEAWDKYIDAWVVIKIKDPSYVYRWRLQAEIAMRQAGKAGMSDDEVNDFVSRYLPAYKAYLPTLYEEGPSGSDPERVLAIDIDEERNPILAT